MKKASPQQFPPTARSLPIALLRAREAVMAPIRDMLSSTGITEQQWRVLRVLAEQGAMDTNTLADRSSLLLPSLTRIAKTMADKGLVTQTRNSQDRRRQMIDITGAGQRIIDDHAATAAQITADLHRHLGAQDYETLLSLLRKLEDRTKATNLKAARPKSSIPKQRNPNQRSKHERKFSDPIGDQGRPRHPARLVDANLELVHPKRPKNSG